MPRGVKGSGADNQTGAAQWTAPAPGRGLATRPRSPDPLRSVVVDVDVDLVGNVDGGLAPAEAELAAEQEQQNQNDDDQQDYGKDAAPAATAGFDHGRTLVFGAVVVGHGNSPC